MNDHQLSRRAFLAATTTTFIAGACAAQPNTAQVVPGKKSPNERPILGVIGLGGRSRDIGNTALGIPQAQIVAVCDCFQNRVDRYLGTLGKDQKWKGYTNFREMIEKEKLDGVFVETTTHARAWVVCNALAAGVDTYIEKPMCLTIAEGREMVKTARHYNRVTQVGTQQRSMPLNNWASDLAKNGALGKLKEVLAPNFVGGKFWTAKPGEDLPEGGPEGWWDVWTNQAELRPYRRELQESWANYRDYDGGGMCFGVSGWGTHSYDQVQRGLGTDETGPVEVLLEEPVQDLPACVGSKDRKPGPDETGAGYYGMAWTTSGPRAKVTMKFADGVLLKLHLDGDNGPGLGCVFVGEKGRVEVNRDKISSDKPELIAGSDRPPALTVPETQPHIENFIECIKTRKRCNADIEYGQRASTLCSLVNIARDVNQVGKPLGWDPVAERFTNCDEGNKLLANPRRAGYELPKIG
jgi:predicted dehydrogenase